jgi:uncharacterized protein (DUF849 family)
MIVQAALNGARKSTDQPLVPQVQDDVVRSAIEAVAAGANELHIHVHSAADQESLRPEVVDPLMQALRSALPGTLIGISSGAWIMADDAVRLACIEQWRFPPDHASVNIDEAGAVEVVRSLLARGIGIEAGLSTGEDAEKLIDSGLAPLVMRVLIEPRSDTVDGTMGHADRILDVLARLDSPKPILMHGSGVSAWPMIDRAFASGFSTRVGFEDTAVLPDGSPAESNAELVVAAVARRQR